MLNDLKRALGEEEQVSFETSAMLEAAMDIKDVFLDNPEMALLGAEEDPEVRKLVEDVPEYDDDNDKETKRDIEALTEALSATAVAEPPQSTESIKAHINRLEILNSKLRSQIELYRKRGNTYQVAPLQARVKQNENHIDELRTKLIKSR